MREDHEEPGWPTPEQEATLDAIAKTLRPRTRADLDETNRRCAEAMRYRLRQEAHDNDQGELPADGERGNSGV
jgi:hypothetical protein